MRSVKLVWSLIFVFCSVIVLGQPKAAGDWLVKTREHNQLKMLNREFGFPDTPIPQNKAVVILNLEGANLSVLVVGPTSGAAEAYAGKLDAIRAENGLTGEVVFSQEDDCAAAFWRHNSGGFGKTEAKLDFDIRRAMLKLGEIDKGVSIALSASNYSNTSMLGSPDFTTSRGVKLFNFSAHPPKIEHLVSEIKIPAWVPIALVLWFILPGFGALFTLGAGLYLSKRSTKPMAQRRASYAKWVKYGTYGVLGVHSVLVFGTLPTRALDPVAQVWFGTRFTSIAIMALPVFMFFPIVMMVGLSKYETKLFGPTEDEAKVLEDFSEFKDDVDELAQKNIWSRISSGLPYLILVAVLLLPSGKENQLKMVLTPILFLCVLLPSLLSLRKFRPHKSEREPKWATAYLGRAQESYTRVRQYFPQLPPMTIKGTSIMLVPYNATVLGDVVSVTGPMAARFTEDELDWVMAHELAHLELGHLRKRRWLLLLPVVTGTVLSVSLIFQRSMAVTLSPAFIFSPFLLILIALPFFTKFVSSWMQNQEFEADALALDRTGNLSAALSALKKLTTQNTLPGFDEVDFGSTHPAMHKRIERLRLRNAPPKF